METYLWKINKEKLNKTNLALYSDFIKKKYKINLDCFCEVKRKEQFE